jgi:formylglycine-generating enzyme
MKTFVASCIVLCGLAGSAWGQTKEAAKKPATGPKKMTVDLGGGVKMEMTLIPAGEFKMGSGESAEATVAFFAKALGADFYPADFFEDEHPQHRVRITHAFYLGTYHVTRGQFRQFVADTHYKTDAEKGEKPGAYGWNLDDKEVERSKKYSWRNAGFEQSDEHPVVNVSWNDAMAFCNWLGKKERKTYRLPTEAEWEYACRAGTTTRYYSGDDLDTLAKVGNVADAAAKAQLPKWRQTIKANDGYVYTAPVGKFKPNAFGLYDMHGNADQWCADWADPEYYATSPVDDPTGPDSGRCRTLRGGSWCEAAFDARSARRGGLMPDTRKSSIGFRVARTQ